MTIHIATNSDITQWIALRAALWPDTSIDDHHTEATEILSGCPHQCIGFVCIDGNSIIAFAEASLRHDHVNGCDTSPVAFLEGIFVKPEHQGTGIGRKLLAAVQTWAQERGSQELASDADLSNTASHAFHAALGFAETERVVYFRKPLP